MKALVFTMFLACVVQVNAQNDNYYSLQKNGKQYPKIVRYVLLGNQGEKIELKSEIVFNISKQHFKHKLNIHKKDTCNVSVLNTLKVVSVSQLFKDEFEEHKRKSKLEGINIPPPMKHYNLKVFIVESLDNEKIIKYEVDWPYSIP